MTVREGLDETDMKILDLLREDSRLSYREIGKRIHVSTGTVSERVKHMMESGVIRRFTTAVNPALLGLDVPMFLRVRVNPLESIENVVKRFERVEEACCIHYVTGDLDMIVLVRCTDHDHAANVLDTIRTMKGVERVDSNVVLKAYPQCGRCMCDCGIPSADERT
jgi:Lrp/AsnC family transcriptional regulator for asnA, asnC and gidA